MEVQSPEQTVYDAWHELCVTLVGVLANAIRPAGESSPLRAATRTCAKQ